MHSKSCKNKVPEVKEIKYCEWKTIFKLQLVCRKQGQIHCVWDTSAMCRKVGLWAVQGYQVMPSVQNIEMRKEKRKNTITEGPAMYYAAIYKMQFFCPPFRGISPGHGWQHKYRQLHFHCEPANYQTFTGAEVYSTLSFGFIFIPSRFWVFFLPSLSQWWQIVLIYSRMAWSNRAEAWYWIAALRVCWGSVWSLVSPDEPLALSHLIWTYVFAVMPLNSSTTKYLQ